MNYELRHGLSGEVYFATSESRDNSLSHWGVKGMKWGVRRYQNKDGSLTPRGKKRYKAEMEKLKEEEKVIKRQEANKAKASKIEAKRRELDARKKALESDEVASPKKSNTKAKSTSGTESKPSIKDMSDDELRDYTTRMRLEKDFYDAQKNLAAANPKKVSAGEKFARSVLDEAVMPAVKNAGKAWLEKTIKESLGIKEEKKLSWDDMTKKQTWEKNEANKKLDEIKRELDILNQQKALNRLKEELRNKDNNAKAQEERDRVLYEHYNDRADRPNATEPYRSGPKQTFTGTKPETTSAGRDFVTGLLNAPAKEGTVEGVGSSSKKASGSSNKTANKGIVDADGWYNAGLSDLPVPYTNRGQNYIAGLLGEPKRMDD